MIKKLGLLLLAAAFIGGCSVPSKVLRVYFYDSEGKMTFVERERPTVEQPLSIAIDQLMAGPNDQESAKGISSEIPQGMRARNVEIDGDTAIVDMNSVLHDFSGNAADAKKMVAQIVYTATDIKGIKQVMLKFQGSDQFTIGSENYLIDHPLTRDDIKN
jgi:spore germination protein GerM